MSLLRIAGVSWNAELTSHRLRTLATPTMAASPPSITRDASAMTTSNGGVLHQEAKAKCMARAMSKYWKQWQLFSSSSARVSFALSVSAVSVRSVLAQLPLPDHGLLTTKRLSSPDNAAIGSIGCPQARAARHYAVLLSLQRENETIWQ